MGQNVLRYNPHQAFMPTPPENLTIANTMPMLFYGRGGQEDNSLVFPQDIQDMFKDDPVRSDQWAALMVKATGAFPATTQNAPRPSAPPRTTIEDYAGAKTTLEKLKSDATMRVIKAIAGKLPTYSFVVAAPKESTEPKDASAICLHLHGSDRYTPLARNLRNLF